MTSEEERKAAWEWFRNHMAYRPPEVKGDHQQQLKSALYFGWQKGCGHGVEREREECAKIADEREDSEAKYSSTCLQAAGGKSAAWGIAEAIRARGKE